MDKAGVQAWLDRYVDAWLTYDPETIKSLFTEDAHYSYHPYDEDVVGRDAIVRDWLDGKDEPGTYEARYEPFASDGDTAVARGWSKYWDKGASHDGQPRMEFANVYLVKFAPDGRASDFREFFMETREGVKKRMEKAASDAVEKARAEWQQGGSSADSSAAGPVDAAEARELAETAVQG